MSTYHGDVPTSAPQGKGMVAVEQARVRSEIESQIIIARKFNRDPQAVMARVMRECRQFGLASQATYKQRRGSTPIEGGTIRLAECIARAMGNMRWGVRIVARHEHETEAVAWCWDLETNATEELAVKCAHVRDTENGPVPVTTQQAIHEVVMSHAMRQVRKAIEAHVPESMMGAAIELCQDTVRKSGGDDEEAQFRCAVEQLAGLGVSAEMLKERYGQPVERMGKAAKVGVIRVRNALIDGFTVVEDWFDPQSPAAQRAAKEAALASARPPTERAGERPAPGPNPTKRRPAPVDAGPDRDGPPPGYDYGNEVQS